MFDAIFGIPGRLKEILLSAGSEYSLASLATALLIAAGFLVMRRRSQARPMPIGVLLRALFPRRVLASRSAGADCKYFVLNTLMLGSILGGAIVSSVWVSGAVTATLVDTFGPLPAGTLPKWCEIVIVTAALFLAFEFAYWLEHYLSHTVPVLWEFHKVHHSAEVLTPLTNARIHPVNAMMFLNMVALSVGITRGVLDHLFGAGVGPFTIAHTNALFVLFTFTTAHLQHSHVWIAFTGVWGRVLLSPAHHQIHHSTDPRHFDKNFGSSLAIFDWMFGTLYVPGAQREVRTFGVDGLTADHNTLAGGLAGPFRAAWELLRRGQGRVQARPVAAE